MRTFIAVELPSEVQQSVGEYVQAIENSFNGVKWVAPQNLHFTVKFLGEVDPGEVKCLEECMVRAVSDIRPFTLALSGVGYFPSERKPRVVWIGADGGADRLLDVFQSLETCLEESGYDREARMFSPHLTIGRAKRDKTVELPDHLPDFGPVEFRVGGIALIKSTLTPNGAIYSRMFECMMT